MRFVTFNISSGRSPADGRFDVDRFAGVIAGLDADVLSLQEVDRGQQRSNGVDLTEVAAAAMGAAHRVFAPTLYGTPGRRWTRADGRPRGGPAFGCALLSRRPLRDVSLFAVPAAPVAVPLWVPGSGPVILREEPRVAIIAESDVGRRGGLTVVGTHLPFVPLWNRWHLRRLVENLRARSGPVLLLGDLNLRGTAAATVTGYRSLAVVPTFPSSAPRFQLDHVLLRGGPDDLGPVTGTSTPAVDVSDHRPLVVDIDTDA